MEWIAKTSIEDQIVHFPWLQSRADLLEVVQRACDQTEAWLHRAVDTSHAQETTLPIPMSMSLFTPSVEVTLPALIQMYKHNPRPDTTTQCSATVRTMVREYELWVLEWNKQLQGFVSWFPFPTDESAQQGSI